ncbi:hypothetical protein [Shewanella marisflavi]|uniref:hypothetical protein n=1 Tax=Shewanella marisflavi TaxID=260364 RepID=UPI003AAFB090
MSQQRLIEIGALLTSPINKAAVESEKAKDSGKQLLTSLASELIKEGVDVNLALKNGDRGSLGLYSSNYDLFIGLDSLQYVRKSQVTLLDPVALNPDEFTGASLQWDLDHVLRQISQANDLKRVHLLSKHTDIIQAIGEQNSLAISHEYRDLFKWMGKNAINLEGALDDIASVYDTFFERFVTIARDNSSRHSYELKGLEVEALNLSEENPSIDLKCDFIYRVMDYEKLFKVMCNQETELINSSVSPDDCLECYMKLDGTGTLLYSERFEGVFKIYAAGTGPLTVAEPALLKQMLDNQEIESLNDKLHDPSVVATFIINHLNNQKCLPDSAYPHLDEMEFARSISKTLCTDHLLKELFINPQVDLSTKKQLTIYLPHTKLIDLADLLLEARNTSAEIDQLTKAISEVKPEFESILKSVQISSLISGIGQGRLSAGNFTEQSALTEQTTPLPTPNSL